MRIQKIIRKLTIYCRKVEKIELFVNKSRCLRKTVKKFVVTRNFFLRLGFYFVYTIVIVNQNYNARIKLHMKHFTFIISPSL